VGRCRRRGRRRIDGGSPRRTRRTRRRTRELNPRATESWRTHKEERELAADEGDERGGRGTGIFDFSKWPLNGIGLKAVLRTGAGGGLGKCVRGGKIGACESFFVFLRVSAGAARVRVSRRGAGAARAGESSGRGGWPRAEKPYRTSINTGSGAWLMNGGGGRWGIPQRP